MKATGAAFENLLVFARQAAPSTKGLLRNGLLVLGYLGILFFYIAAGRLHFGTFPNVIVPSILVILGAMMFGGARVLTLTLFDYFFVGWFVLAFCSHIFANEVLYRNLTLLDLTDDLSLIASMALMYRAFFALTRLAPRIATRTYLVSAFLVLFFLVVLGLIQRFGPGQATAVKVGEALAVSPIDVQISASTGRPSAVFTNPNMLGYSACVLSAFVLGWGSAMLGSMKPIKAFLVTVGLTIPLACAVAAQSRQSLSVLVLALVIFPLLVRLKSLDPRNVVVVCTVIGVMAFGAVAMITRSKSDYLTQTTHTGISHDLSYKMRQQEINLLKGVAREIAPLGSGKYEANTPYGTLHLGYSRYYMPTVDNEWANMFEGFGVWGPLLIALFYVFFGKTLKEVWANNTPEAREACWIGIFMLLFNLILATTAARIAKYETAGFTFQLLGVLSAWRAVGIERGIISRRWSLAPAVLRVRQPA